MSQKEYIVIRGHGSISPLGHNQNLVAKAYKTATPTFGKRIYQHMVTPVGALSEVAENFLKVLKQEKKNYQSVDRSVLLAIIAARQAVAAAGWLSDSEVAINIGSSRGATELFENYLTEYLTTGQVPAPTSPVTTLGNISSWVANDLQTNGPVVSHSVTCSTTLQAIANGFAWLKSGMATRFLAGGAEAPLTPFTIAQMKAIGIYSQDQEPTIPCRPLNEEKKNTFVLGEGAAIFALEKVSAAELNNSSHPPIIIESVGFATEAIPSKTGLSKDGQHFQKAIRNALQQAENTQPIDLIILHAPGTVAGDAAEIRALQAVFGENNLPPLTSNKWLIGHTLGASAAFSLEYAIHLLQHLAPLSFPYPCFLNNKPFTAVNRILILAAGFGGNAAAVILSSGKS
ncbi:beta-ketoacyl synthase N-terminal-like domain-containing protein [Adhaeribacter rhizoryzae]|uniref:beta-ketoacyl synthase N-terminal-like domain-containing protein n=1 Tax=Adhaeribacter rhizoryzae TaxID=2607907 RepID=UPI001CC21804|nr:beta-ketoacyl synthase N-terminal-like domain-containing protein [Adhaeribacter rhizoryzae]